MAESKKHRQTFEVYWRLGAQRSIPLLHQALSETMDNPPAERTLYEWSSKYHWQSRIARLEHEARIAEDEVRVAEIREMYERQAKQGRLMQEKGIELLRQISPDSATFDQAIKAVVEGAKLEITARGEPTSRQEVNIDFDARFQEISDDKVDALIQRAYDSLGGTSEAPS